MYSKKITIQELCIPRTAPAVQYVAATPGYARAAPSYPAHSTYSSAPVPRMLHTAPPVTSGSESPPANTGHIPRPPRPSYSEEQKFFIMYCRIMRDEKWEDIEARFARFFGSRTRGGLTSVYYRIRRDWGMHEVLKSGPAFYPNDIKVVQARASRFSREFLTAIDYPV